METRKLAVIMFTDMVGYSKKVHADEEQALKLLSRHNEILAAQIDAYQGHVIKTIGDAFFADFDSVFSAVNCAIDIQKKLVEANEGRPEEEQMQVRIGIHVGDVIYRDDDVFGDGVNIASRIEYEKSRRFSRRSCAAPHIRAFLGNVLNRRGWQGYCPQRQVSYFSRILQQGAGHAMKFEHFAINVEDPPAVAAWYVEHLSMEIVRHVGEPTHMHFLADATGRVVIELYNNPPDLIPDYATQDPQVLHMAFAVEDMEGALARLQAAGATKVGGPGQTPFGDVLAMIRDPWGFAIQLTHRAEPMV